MSTLAPSPRTALAATAHGIVDTVLRHHDELRDKPVVRVTGDAALREKLRVIPRAGRPVQEVVDQLTTEVFPWATQMGHPRFYGFIPSPASPVSWLGDMLTSGFNPHGASWLQGSGPAMIELACLEWLAREFGFPADAGGVFVSGGSHSNLTACMVARDRRLTHEQRPRGVIYYSDQTHTSVLKALLVLGFHRDQIRVLPTDDAFRLRPDLLAAAVAADRAAGRVPFLVVANAGTTNTGAVDPLADICALARRENLWVHVDGAFGAAGALVPGQEKLFRGLGEADSITFDAHKWAFQTFACSCVLVRRRADLFQIFSIRPEYLRDAATDDEHPNFSDYGIELTRPHRALKFWLTLQVLGEDELRRRIAHGIAQAELLEPLLAALPGCRIISRATNGLVAFRFEPPGLDTAATDTLNAAIAKWTQADGRCGVLSTRLRNQTALRICTLSPDATADDLRITVEALRDALAAELRTLA